MADVRIERLASGGNGLAHLPSGKVVFVPRTAPGDRVRIQVTRNRKRWARGVVKEWRARGPERVTPPCPHFEECGGCSLQHLSATAQAAAIRQSVIDALTRVGRIDLPVDPLNPSDARFGYRNRITFTLRRRDGEVRAGFHSPLGPSITDVDQCALAERPIRRAWSALRSVWGRGASALPSGPELRLTLRASAAGECALHVVGGQRPGDWKRIMAGVPRLTSYWWTCGSRRIHLGGKRHFEDVWDGVSVPLRPEAFIQVNRTVAPLLDRYVTEQLGDARERGTIKGKKVLDLYGGVGLRARAWAAQGAQVTSVDSSPDAVATASDICPKGTVHCSTAESMLESGPSADAIVVNPPRGGLSDRAAELLTGFRAARLVYVSCDPFTLARDVRRLVGGWAPIRARPFDMFPQTHHVETVVTLVRSSG